MDAENKPIGRRLFLSLSAVGVGTLLFGHAFSGGDEDGSSGLVGELFGQGGFRIYTVAPIPKFDPAAWRLVVGGMAARTLEFTYDQLLALPSVTQTGTFHCVTGWSVPNLTWQGVSLASVLAMVEPRSEAQGVLFTSADGAYTDALSLEQAHAPDVLLAYSMNGKPLPLNQGMPLRLLVPEMFGYKSVKWLNKIELALKPVEGYWEVRGYDVDAYIDKRS
ncbi:MAG: molybdopterin-dependent oxidoreductase [Chloroflexi bacterium]|nr:molybdopterin-dependent oxidoreductase [Chloroflexota bacterium]